MQEQHLMKKMQESSSMQKELDAQLQLSDCNTSKQ